MQILIGGASGVAKSTQAMNVCKELNIVHKIGSGFIREIARNFISDKVAPSLHEFSFGNDNHFDNPYLLLKDQSKYLFEPTLRCLRRAKKEGTSIVIEGVNILPNLYNQLELKNKFILYVDDKNIHWDMINGETHSKRVITKDQFEKVRRIQDSFIDDAKRNNWKLIESVNETIVDFLK